MPLIPKVGVVSCWRRRSCLSMTNRKVERGGVGR
jgi:hypothetical protein